MDIVERLDRPALGQSSHRSIARQTGYLRAPQSESMLNASNDVEAVQAWLSEYQVGDYSGHTLAAARREAERFVLWSAIELGKPISDLRREDVNAYRLFLANPQPDDLWCGDRVRRASKDWKPFNGPLKPSSVNQAMVILKGLFDYLVDMRYLTASPIGRMGRRKSGNKDEEHDTRRMIDSVMWQAVVDHVERWPKQTKAQRYHYERSRYVIILMYLLAPRIADLPNHTMGDIEFLPHDDGSHGWWWRAKGKGDKTVKLPMNDDAIGAVTRWRRVCGLSDLPEVNDPMPLVGRIGNPSRSIGANMVYRLVSQVMKGAAKDLEEVAPERAETLRQVSPHWLRHTALSKMAEVLPAPIVRDLARHSDIKTTSRYIHTGNLALYRAAQRHRIDWSASAATANA